MPVDNQLYDRLGDTWWEEDALLGLLRTSLNPGRFGYMRRVLTRDLAMEPRGRTALDVGCGGGLLSEPVARMGASVTGADPSEKNIGIASTHAKASGVSVDYRAVTAEELADAGETFDIVLNMEVVEHVADVEFFMTTCAKMVRPGGLIFVATINRTMKAAALAIFAAENILRWLPRGTHQYEKLVRPEELERPLTASGIEITDRTGVFFNPLSNQWNLSKDMDVNYMLLAKRSA